MATQDIIYKEIAEAFSQINSHVRMIQKRLTKIDSFMDLLKPESGTRYQELDDRFKTDYKALENLLTVQSGEIQRFTARDGVSKLTIGRILTIDE